MIAAIIESLLGLIGIGKGLRAGDPGPHEDLLERAYQGGHVAPTWDQVAEYPLASWPDEYAVLAYPGGPDGALEALSSIGIDEHLVEWLETAEGWGLL